VDHMAIDQYGETYHGLGEYPRKALMARLDNQHAANMYRDDKDGNSFHVGYVIGNLWLTVYKVEPMRDPV